MWHLPFSLPSPFRSPSLPSPTSKIIVRGCLYTTYHTHTSPYVYIGRIRFMVFPPAASKATLIYVEEFLYYTLGVYDLLYILISILVLVLRVPYIYTLKLRPKVIFSIYIYTLYVYDSTYAISVDCAGATLVALLYIYVIRIILKGIYVYVLRLRFSPCENLAQSALAFGLEFVLYIRISYIYYIYVLRIR